MRKCIVWSLCLAVMLAPAAVAQEHGGPASRAVGSEQYLNEYGRLFDAVVARIDEHFVYDEKLKAIDWKARAATYRERVSNAETLAEAAAVINALLAELTTSHTALYTRTDVEYYMLLDVFGSPRNATQQAFPAQWGGFVQLHGIGAFTATVAARHFVDGILQGSPAEQAGLKIGDEILSVDGTPYHPIASFRGKAGSAVQVRFRRSVSGDIEAVAVPVLALSPLKAFADATRASARMIERAGKRIGYMQVWASKDDTAFIAALQSLVPRGLQATRIGDDGLPITAPPTSGTSPVNPTGMAPHGLVIDMRGRIGGLSTTALNYLLTLERPGSWMRFTGRGGRMESPRHLKGRIAVLTDHHTRSTAELFVYGFKREKLGTVIGTTTAGAVSGAGLFAMPGGNLLYIAVSRVEVDGQTLEGKGVEPDIRVERPLAFAAGADPVLEAAVEHLTNLPPS